ncbi:hypothetical protein EMIT048CA2_180109 [Pseudomonas chlororaphis]
MCGAPVVRLEGLFRHPAAPLQQPLPSDPRWRQTPVPEPSALKAAGRLRMRARRAVAGTIPGARGEPANGCTQLSGMI